MNALDLSAAVISPLMSSIATVAQTPAAHLLPTVVTTALQEIVGACFVMVVIALFRDRFAVTNLKTAAPKIFKVAILRGSIGGILFILGLHYSTAIKAVFFTKIEPYFVLFWGWVLYREKIKRSEFLLLAVHLAGAFFLSTGGYAAQFGSAQIGDLCILLSMAISGYTYGDAKELSVALGARISVAVTTLLGGLLLLPIVLIRYPAEILHAPSLAWWSIISSALLFNTIALPLWYRALKTVPRWIVSAVRAIGPLAGAPAAYFLLGESLSMPQAAGGIIVVLTSAMIVIQHWRSQHRGS